jgi:hypothetical protein
MQQASEAKYKAAVVLDNMPWCDTGIPESAFGRSRILGTLLICSVQSIFDVPHETRSDVDLLFLCGTPRPQELETLHRDYFTLFRNYRDFRTILDGTCAKGSHECLVLDLRKARTDVNNCLSYHKATVRDEPFCVGNQPLSAALSTTN